ASVVVGWAGGARLRQSVRRAGHQPPLRVAGRRAGRAHVTLTGAGVAAEFAGDRKLAAAVGLAMYQHFGAAIAALAAQEGSRHARTGRPVDGRVGGRRVLVAAPARAVDPLRAQIAVAARERALADVRREATRERDRD